MDGWYASTPHSKSNTALIKIELLMSSLHLGNFAKPLGELGWPLWQADLGLGHPWSSLLHQHTLTFNLSVLILY